MEQNDISENYIADLTYIYDLMLKNSREMTKRTILVYMLNIIKICTFAFIAVKFDTWWIVLFSILFQSTVPSITIQNKKE